MKRTHTCGELTKPDVGKTVILQGWVHSRRDLGGVTFIGLRDRYGITQVQVNAAQKLGYEFVVEIAGTVQARPGEQVRKDQGTGEIEVIASEVTVLNQAKTPPFLVEDDPDASEELRLKNRYLDLRRPNLQAKLINRHLAAQSIRQSFTAEGFLEIETPVLGK